MLEDTSTAVHPVKLDVFRPVIREGLAVHSLACGTYKRFIMDSSTSVFPQSMLGSDQGGASFLPMFDRGPMVW